MKLNKVLSNLPPENAVGDPTVCSQMPQRTLSEPVPMQGGSKMMESMKLDSLQQSRVAPLKEWTILRLEGLFHCPEANLVESLD